MGLSHRKQSDGSDRFDGEIGGMRFVVLYGPDGKVLSGERSKAPPFVPIEHPPEKPKITIWQLITLPLNLAMAHIGFDLVDDKTYAMRRGECEGTPTTPKCENYDLGVCGGEKGCGCYLAAKIRLKSASCPIKRW